MKLIFVYRRRQDAAATASKMLALQFQRIF
jgi:hypothetical protein